ncbi:MAG: cysteine desulfurase [Parcubacteria group bacterium Gr01-1014_66]|nr:MAG: cysteine desulfurase [Parcubacteria group bacterium Gr01-1014_66]
MNHRAHFPIFGSWKEEDKPLVYLDSAAMAQMPREVMDAVMRYEERSRANVHRGIYALSEQATAAYEQAREIMRQFINAQSAREIVFVRNTTEAINLVAFCVGKSLLKPGDHILISRAEHHSNFLPWVALCEEKGFTVDIIDPDEDGLITLETLKKGFVIGNTKLVALSHISHVLGAINPVREIGEFLHQERTLFLVDAAQSAAHLPIDVQEMQCDFLAFSGHKIGAPAGIGVLYGREELLERMPPFLRGGGMIRSLHLESGIAEWGDLPQKFEAGTPNVSGAVGLAAAIGYMEKVGFDVIREIDEDLTRKTFKELGVIPEIRLLGPENPGARGGVVSFSLAGVHPHDLATILDRVYICIRAGHHCAIPLHQWLGVGATARASFWVYNTQDDITKLAEGVEKALYLLHKKHDRFDVS